MRLTGFLSGLEVCSRAAVALVREASVSRFKVVEREFRLAEGLLALKITFNHEGSGSKGKVINNSSIIKSIFKGEKEVVRDSLDKVDLPGNIKSMKQKR